MPARHAADTSRVRPPPASLKGTFRSHAQLTTIDRIVKDPPHRRRDRPEPGPLRLCSGRGWWRRLSSLRHCIVYDDVSGDKGHVIRQCREVKGVLKKIRENALKAFVLPSGGGHPRSGASWRARGGFGEREGHDLR